MSAAEPTRRRHTRRVCTRGGLAGGFTLIELIAVVIILGILSAVIMPRYFDTVEKARTTVTRGALSEGVARFYNACARYMVDTGQRATTLSNLDNASYLDLNGGSTANLGDFDVTYAITGTDVTVTATAHTGGGTASTTVPLP